MAKILMPKATTVWLLENTTLTFKQISDFCELHILEVQGIADEEIGAKMPGISPITSKILTKEEIKKCENNTKLKLNIEKVNNPNYWIYTKYCSPNNCLLAFFTNKIS